MYKYLLGLTLLTLSTYAAAATVSLKYDSPEDTIVSKVLVGNKYVSGLFGSYNLREKNAADTFIGFCVEPLQFASRDYKTYTESALDQFDFKNSGASRLENVQKLFDNAYAGIVGDAIKSAGFHLALWEIFLDDSNLTKGDIKVSKYTNTAMKSYAAGLLSSLDNWNVKNFFSLTLYTNKYQQDYVGFTPVSPVPVPAALPLLVSSLIGLGFIRRRKNA